MNKLESSALDFILAVTEMTHQERWIMFRCLLPEDGLIALDTMLTEALGKIE